MTYISIKDGLRQALLANADIVELVGDRIYSAFAPRTATPAGPWIVISQISGQEETSFSGNDYLSRPRFQLTISGTDQARVDEVRSIIVYAFNAGTFTDGDGNRFTFFYADDSDAWEEGPRVFRSMVDLYVWANTQP